MSCCHISNCDFFFSSFLFSSSSIVWKPESAFANAFLASSSLANVSIRLSFSNALVNANWPTRLTFLALSF